MSHAKLSPSASERWMNCPASVKAIALMPETVDESSSFAAEGTAAHDLAATCLTTGMPPEAFKHTVFSGYLPDKEMLINVQTYLDYIDEILEDIYGTLHVEIKVDYSRWVQGGFGTSDAIICDKDDNCIHVVDLKYGRGIEVYAENNTQLQLYALGAYEKFNKKYDIQKVKMHIVQPRINNISSWEIPIGQLLEFGEYATHRANLTLLPNAPFSASEEACQWCSAKSYCEELAKVSLQTMSVDFSDLTQIEPVEVPMLTAKDISVIYDKLPLLKSWIKAVEEAAQNLVQTDELEGFKLVAGRNSRKWKFSDEDIVKLLVDEFDLDPEQVVTSETISVAQCEKLLDKDGKKELKDYYISISGKAQIVPADDKRPALTTSLDDFDTLE